MQVDGAWIEFLIPVTITATALWNLRRGAGSKGRGNKTDLLATVGFGLIHGLGFSSFFRMMREGGESIVMPLLRFNLGVEAGQLLILVVCLALASLARAVKSDGARTAGICLRCDGNGGVPDGDGALAILKFGRGRREGVRACRKFPSWFVP